MPFLSDETVDHSFNTQLRSARQRITSMQFYASTRFYTRSKIDAVLFPDRYNVNIGATNQALLSIDPNMWRRLVIDCVGGDDDDMADVD